LQVVVAWQLSGTEQPVTAISPDAERFMAQRMGATTETIDGSHTAFIAKPVAVATFIRQALR
jgi:hypothetical protein